MSRPRPPRPRTIKLAPPTPACLDRIKAAERAARRRRLAEAWSNAVVKESWRLVYADGGRSCGQAEFERGERSLIDQGFRPPR